ncbi:MAG: DNA cytosine methyltransferase, partial [Chloroflexi bacterium]|nr:DNA cytosine methyltransferase [Chloroflexota bacterium]
MKICKGESIICMLPNPVFTFIDLFAGIGGFRLAFESAGAKCVFSSEWDEMAQKTYEANFSER